MKIVVEPNQILHQLAQPVTVFDDKLQKLIVEMRATMHEHNGMGLAAPQIKQSLQLAVIEYLPRNDKGHAIPFFALINPQITWFSKRLITMTEGCLSIPSYEGEVSRPKRIKVKAQNELGEPITIKASGLLARIMQHEIDHLNGILYTDKLLPGTTLTPTPNERQG